MTKNWIIKKSQIDGLGAFASKSLMVNQPVGVAVARHPVSKRWFITQDFGRYPNHSAKYKNTVLKLLADNQYWLVATRNIHKGEEILANYNEPTNPPMIRRVDFNDKSLFLLKFNI